MFSPCQIELSEAALRQNIRFLEAQIGSGTRFCSVIKGNAYGHGIETFVPLAERCGVRRFAVFSGDEALRAQRSLTQTSDVLVMGDLDGPAIEWAVESGIGFYVFDRGRLDAAEAAARRVGRRARVHLEVETGLHRTGFDRAELRRVVRRLVEAADVLSVDGVTTHYAGAESVGNYLRIQHQLAAFRETVTWLRAEGVTPPLRHTACSAAALTYPETRMDLVRFGIAHYGFWPSQETRMHWALRNDDESNRRSADPLRRVMRLKSRVMAVKHVPRGEFVGYGTAYLTTRRQTFAAVPVGYFHGFARSLSNLGHVLVCGRRAPVAGLVNMNMMMVDVTDIPAVQSGDEVVIIGRQKRAEITVASFSDMTRFLNYEVLVRLPSDIPRVVVA